MGTPGRKTKFTADIARKAYKLSLLGMTDKEMIEFFGIAEQTWYNWQKRFPSLREAIQKGKADADSEVAYSLYRKACGYSHPDVHIITNQVKEYDAEGKVISSHTEPLLVDIIKHYAPDTAAACFWLKNRSRRRNTPWLEIARTEITGKKGGPIQTENINANANIDLSDLSDEELKMMERIGLALHQKGQDDEDEGED